MNSGDKAEGLISPEINSPITGEGTADESTSNLSVSGAESTSNLAGSVAVSTSNPS